MVVKDCGKRLSKSGSTSVCSAGDKVNGTIFQRKHILKQGSIEGNEEGTLQ
jgi:hypothetical protein